MPICVPQHSKSLERAKQLAGDLLTADDRAQIQMLEMLCVAESQLESIQDASSHFSMIQACDAQLDTVKSSCGESWTTDAELQYQSIKLYMFGMTFTQDFPTVHEQQTQAVFYRQIVLEKCLQAASSYILTMTQMSNLTIGGKRHPIGALTFHPRHPYFTALLMAASSIFRFLISYHDLRESQQQQAVHYLTEAHKIFQSFPDNRDATRAAIHIEMMVNIIRNSPRPDGLSGVELAIRNRLGSSVLFDSVFRGGQLRNRRTTDGANPPVSEWVSLTKDYALRLPLAPEQKMPSPDAQQWSIDPTSNPTLPLRTAGWEAWDSYSNDFAIMNEPWMMNDAEFNKECAAQQQTFPAAGYVSDIYGNVRFPSGQ